MSNPFLDLAEKQTSSPVKARQRAAEKRRAKQPMVPTPAEKKIREQEQLLRRYLKAWRERAEELCEDAVYGARMGGLLQFLKERVRQDDHGDVDECLRGIALYVESCEWSGADETVRQDVLHFVNDAMTKIRLRAGLDPIDDPLLGQPDSPFQQVRRYLR